MTGTDPVRERMLKEAAQNLAEASQLLAVEKQAMATQAAGADPIAFAKQASLARAYANLKYVDDVNALLGAMQKVAEEKGELPYAVDHPYMNRFMKSLPGMGIGAGVGGAVGAIASHELGVPLGSAAAAGGLLGAAVGQIPGMVESSREHDEAVHKLEDEGHKLNFVTRHPYITEFGAGALGGGLGSLGAIAAHHVLKQDLARDVRDKAKEQAATAT